MEWSWRWVGLPIPQDEQDRTNSGRLPAESCWRYWPYEQLQPGSNKIPPSYKETKLLRCQKLCVLKVWAWFEGYSERLGLHSCCRREEGENVSSPWTSCTVFSMCCDCMKCEELRARSMRFYESLARTLEHGAFERALLLAKKLSWFVLTLLAARCTTAKTAFASFMMPCRQASGFMSTQFSCHSLLALKGWCSFEIHSAQATSLNIFVQELSYRLLTLALLKILVTSS